MTKACVILGAGASHDVWNRGTLVNDANWQPPLARDLFNIAENRVFNSILERYPGAEYLSSTLGPLSDNAEIAIENALRDLAGHDDPRIVEKFWHIPPYIRDLIFHASRNYVPNPTCHNDLVITLLAKTSHEVLFIDLNYDDFIERSVSGLHGSTPDDYLPTMDDYTNGGHQAKIIKLHGSIDWFVQFPRGGLGWDHAISLVKVPSLIENGPIIIQRGQPYTNRINFDGDFGYPLITAPLAGKGEGATVCPDNHKEVAKEFLKDCNKFLIIGTSGLDDDLLMLLDEEVPVDEKLFVHIVNYEDDFTNASERRFLEGVRAFRSRSTSITKYAVGFREYLARSLIEKFTGYCT